jgi:phage/plasmid-associated DNA primase
VSKKTGLEPLFLSEKKNSVAVLGLNESYFTEYITHLRPHLRYEPATKSFFDYNTKDGLFRPIPIPLLQESILGDVFRFQQAFEQENLSLAGQIEKFRNLQFGQKVVGRLMGRCHWQGLWNSWEGGNFVHLLNGVAVLDAGAGSWSLQGFHPKFNSRRQIKLAYDSKADCPMLKAELLRRIPDNDQRELFQKCFGQFVLGRNLAHKILVIKGPAATGKSSICSLAVLLVGPENTAEFDTRQGGRFTLAQFADCSLLKAFDVQADFLNNQNADHLKRLTGGDLIGSEVKFSNSQTSFRGDKNMLFSSNFDLILREGRDERAMARRLVIVDWCGGEPEKRISDWAGYILRNEGSGVLNYFLEGVLKVLADLQEGHADGFRNCSRNTEAVEGLLMRSNSVRRFLEVCVEPCDGASLTTEAMLESYNQFCRDAGLPAETDKTASEKFNRLVSERYQAPKCKITLKDEVLGVSERVWGWKNIRLNTSVQHQTFTQTTLINPNSAGEMADSDPFEKEGQLLCKP